MICGKPVRISTGYKWGKANALGIMDDNETYLVTTGFDEEFNAHVAHYAVKAINCHAELLASLKELLFNSQHGNGLEAHYKTQDRARAIIAEAEAE